MFGKALQEVAVQGNVQRHWSERVILLDLTNVSQMSFYLTWVSCYHRIKCTTAAFLTALMWRRPLNNVFNYYRPQKTRKSAQQDRYLSARLDDKQVDDGNGLEGTI